MLLQFDWNVFFEYRIHVLFLPAKMPQQMLEERRELFSELQQCILSGWRTRVEHGFDQSAQICENELYVTLVILRVLFPMHVIGEPFSVTTVQNRIFLPSMFDKRCTKSIEVSREQLQENACFLTVIVNVHELQMIIQSKEVGPHRLVRETNKGKWTEFWLRSTNVVFPQ
jgi:hypothetical protein